MKKKCPPSNLSSFSGFQSVVCLTECVSLSPTLMHTPEKDGALSFGRRHIFGLSLHPCNHSGAFANYTTKLD